MVINNDISVLRVTPTPTTKVVAGDAALVSRATGRHRRREEPPQYTPPDTARRGATGARSAESIAVRGGPRRWRRTENGDRQARGMRNDINEKKTGTAVALC